MKCQKCGTELDLSKRFCGGCGTPIGQAMPKVAPIPPAEPNRVPYNQPAPMKKKSVSWATIICIVLISIILILVVGLFGFIKINDIDSVDAFLNYFGYEMVDDEDDKESSKADEDEEEYEEEDEEDNRNPYEKPNKSDKEDDVVVRPSQDGNTQQIPAEQSYVLPGSDSRYITEAELAGMTAEECRLARNEIYARKGRMFTDESLQKYFLSKSWYKATIPAEQFQESMLNAYEVANRDLILAYEAKQGYR